MGGKSPKNDTAGRYSVATWLKENNNKKKGIEIKEKNEANPILDPATEKDLVPWQ